jgi:hypothetical protein
LTGLNSTPNDGATDWRAPNWPVPAGHGGIPQNSRPRHTERDFFEQFEPFCAYAVFEQDETSGITARPRQTIDETGSDRVDRVRKYDRHGAGCPLQCRHSRTCCGQNDVRCERDQFRRKSAIEVGIASAPADVEPHVLTFNPA